LRNDVDGGRDDCRGEADAAVARGPAETEAVALVAQVRCWKKMSTYTKHDFRVVRHQAAKVRIHPKRVARRATKIMLRVNTPLAGPPGGNPTIVSYNAIAVKICNANSVLKTIILYLKNALVYYNTGAVN
jgi:hypothetical protein